MSPNRRNIVICKDIGVNKSNADVRSFTESSSVTVYVHAQ